MSEITNLPTGFTTWPLRGHLKSNQKLCRYLKTKYFIDLLYKKSLWFTKVQCWSFSDPTESELLPVFKKQIRASHKDANSIEMRLRRAIIELNLKTNFGCCFGLYDGNENSHMWDIFTPVSEDFGVLIVFKAENVYESMRSMFEQYPHQYFSKIKYLSDVEAKAMAPDDCLHSSKNSFSYQESHFYKRIAYRNEKESRAILSYTQNNWTTVLHEFIKEENIPIFSSFHKPPEYKYVVKVDMKKK